MVWELARRWRASRSVKNACTVQATAVTGAVRSAGCGSGGGLPRRAARGMPAGTSRCAPGRRGRGRPTAAASAPRYRRRRGTSPAACRLRTNAAGHAAAGGRLPSAAARPAWRARRANVMADVVIEQPGARGGYQQRLAARPREPLVTQLPVGQHRRDGGGVQREQPVAAELGVAHRQQPRAQRRSPRSSSATTSPPRIPVTAIRPISVLIVSWRSGVFSWPACVEQRGDVGR